MWGGLGGGERAIADLESGLIKQRGSDKARRRHVRHALGERMRRRIAHLKSWRILETTQGHEVRAKADIKRQAQHSVMKAEQRKSRSKGKKKRKGNRLRK